MLHKPVSALSDIVATPVIMYVLGFVIMMMSLCIKSSESGTVIRERNTNNMLHSNDVVTTTVVTSLLSNKRNMAANTEEYQETASAELLRFVNDNEHDNRGASSGGSVSDGSNSVERVNKNTMDNDDYSNNVENNDELMESLSLPDQVRLLSKQLNVLMTRRREDYELLERNLLKSLRITQQQQQHGNGDNSNKNNNNINTNDLDLHKELQQLRDEVQSLRSKHLGGNNERLTIEWLQQSVGELRKQLVELQQIASNALRDITTRTQSWEDLTTIRSDFQQLKLELAALKERQQQTEVYVQELREETQQQEEDFRHLVQSKQQFKTMDQLDKNGNLPKSTENSENGPDEQEDKEDIQLPSDLLADHRRRHCRYQREQLHELQMAQRQLKRQLNELKYQRLGARVRSLEIEQHRIADANFNLSRQIASLDKLHVSMLELLEDVETVQSKVDKNVPELRHEISKLEFSNAQLQSEQKIVREESKNLARSVQALAVSISTLQEEREGVRQIQSTVSELHARTDRLQSVVDEVQRAVVHYKHHRGRPDKRSDNKNRHHYTQEMLRDNHNLNIENAEDLVLKLENAEHEFESIIDKLPRDCSEVAEQEQQQPQGSNHPDGLYLIAPNGQPHGAMMAHCNTDGWTTVQRRYDGSANFNRSWEDYAKGFGSPAGEFWIGNENLHQLTLDNCTRLRVLMQDIYDNTWLAEYKQFYISSRSDGYRLHIAGYGGNASDALDYQQDMQFSAIDVDRDISQTHCAANYEGGWWFSHCQHANLNGRYNLGLTWFDAARNEWIAVKSSQMMIKRLSSASCDNLKMASSLPGEDSLLTTTLPPSLTTLTTRPSSAVNSNTSTGSSIMTIVSNKMKILSQTVHSEEGSTQQDV